MDLLIVFIGTQTACNIISAFNMPCELMWPERWVYVKVGYLDLLLGTRFQNKRTSFESSYDWERHESYKVRYRSEMEWWP